MERFNIENTGKNNRFFEFQFNMGEENGCRFGISRANEFFKSVHMENYNFIAGRASFNNIIQLDTMDGTYEKSDKNVSWAINEAMRRISIHVDLKLIWGDPSGMLHNVQDTFLRI